MLSELFEYTVLITITVRKFNQLLKRWMKLLKEILIRIPKPIQLQNSWSKQTYVKT